VTVAKLNFSAFSESDPDIRNEALAEAGPKDAVFAGWIPPDDRDRTQQTIDALIRETIPAFAAPRGGVNEDATKACLWDCWAAAYPKGWGVGVHQITGSCVGAGGGNALFSLACADVVKRRDAERVVVPFWLLPYGVSRMLAGLNSRGDGSWGTTFARAVKEFGHLPADADGLPPWQDKDGLVWGQNAELDWSVGKKIPAKYLDAARPHLVKSTALCRSTDDVREALKNFYAVTCASNWGGLMRPPVQDGVLLNRRATTWNHQMSVQAWWDHPRLGELFHVKNQWGDCHGPDPAGAPPGGFWVAKKDMADIVSQDETFAFSQFAGFPALVEPLDFNAF
jgi:hypothetical protein